MEPLIFLSVCVCCSCKAYWDLPEESALVLEVNERQHSFHRNFPLTETVSPIENGGYFFFIIIKLW